MFFLNRLVLVFPGRMRLGKFGMWMVRVGEVLQLRFAGRNKTFQMKVELLKSSYGAYFHISEKVTNEAELTFYSPNSQRDKQPPFVQSLFAIQGVIHIWLNPYRIRIEWGEVFSPQEILPKAKKVLIEAFTK